MHSEKNQTPVEVTQYLEWTGLCRMLPMLRAGHADTHVVRSAGPAGGRLSQKVSASQLLHM